MHTLDLESFTYLTLALETPLSPLVILASNRGTTTIPGTAFASDPGLRAPHGIPPDLLPRLLIIPTHPYTSPEIRAIVSIRSRLEGGGVLSEEGLDEVVKAGSEVSLRYGLQLLAPAGILARARGSQGGLIGREDVKEARGLFWDVGRSSTGRMGAEGEFIS